MLAGGGEGGDKSRVTSCASIVGADVTTMPSSEDEVVASAMASRTVATPAAAEAASGTMTIAFMLTDPAMTMSWMAEAATAMVVARALLTASELGVPCIDANSKSVASLTRRIR